MGAYLSTPKTDKITTDEQNEYLAACAGSMQGWRTSQEDAHNSILNYDEKTSFFGVYDGHGGAEVSTYTADKLPAFLKSLAKYKNGEIESALVEMFLKFDKTLLESDVVKVLKILSGDERPDPTEISEEDDEDLAGLHEESRLSLKELLKRYKSKELDGEANASEDVDDDDDDGEDDNKTSAALIPVLKRLKEGAPKPQSPYLRGRRAAAVIADAVNKAVFDADAKPEGASTSAAATAMALKNKAAGPSSSKKEDAEVPEEDFTVSSSSSSASKSGKPTPPSTVDNSKASNDGDIANDKPVAVSDNVEAVSKVKVEAKSVEAPISNGAAPDSSNAIKEKEQNGSVTSSEAKPAVKESPVAISSTSATPAKKSSDAIVSGSNEASESKQQNGGSAPSSSSSSSGLLSVAPPVKADRSAISSTSNELKRIKRAVLAGDIKQLNPELMDDSTDDDYEDDDDDDDEDDDDDDADDEVDDEDDDDEMEEDDDDRRMEDDEETVMANQEFAEGMEEEPGKDSGCTAVVALLHGRDLYVANAGDSRCVVSRKGQPIDMSLDHKPEDEKEAARILKAGGRVTCDGRVNGGLNLSRALGDHAYKMRADLPLEEQMISPLPDIKKLIITPDDEFMVLACDGIWNYMSSEEVVNFVRERLARIDYQGTALSKICEELFDHCLAPSTMGDGTGCDNMTAVIVRFKPKLQELPTKINPQETEDVLSAKPNNFTDATVAQSSEGSSLKRLASSSGDDQTPPSNKRMKTDSEVETSSLATSSTITTSTTDSQSVNCAQPTSAVESISSSPAEASSSANSMRNTAADNVNECDSGITESSEAAAASA